MSDQKNLQLYYTNNNHNSMRTSICRSIYIDISVKIGISISKNICISTK